MRSAMRMHALCWALVGLMAVPAAAQERQRGAKVERVVKRVKKTHKEAAESQEEVEALDDAALDLTSQYRNVERRTASLKVYNRQLEALIGAQEDRLSDLGRQIGAVAVVGREVVPLMLRMIDALSEFVALDVPFLLEERTQRVRDLRQMMDRADVSEADKYRRVLEAYQVENEYGRTIEAYRGEVPIGDKDRAVEFLRVGRVALIYRTLDGSQYGAWDAASRSWQPLDGGYERDIVAALRIAREQAAPDLIRVPIPAPTRAPQKDQPAL